MKELSKIAELKKSKKNYILFLLCSILCITLNVNAQNIYPGGATNTTYVAWLTPESYTTGVWANLINDAGDVGNFRTQQGSNHAQKLNTGGYNFHPVVYFTKPSRGGSAAPNQLLSDFPIGIQATNNVTVIFVLRRTVSGVRYDYPIGFSDRDLSNTMSWRNTANDNLSFYWDRTQKDLSVVTEGIFTVDNSNTTATALQEGIRIYKNGVKSTVASNVWDGVSDAGNGRVALGGGRNDRLWYGYEGIFQEVIIIKNNNSQFGGHVEATDLMKIHSYLAVKYGITLDNNDNYLNSDGNIIWDKATNSGYNNNIFGIGRDDVTDLYQKQSQSQNTDILTLFVGNTLTPLNSQNNATLDEKQYVICGNNARQGVAAYLHPAQTNFDDNTTNTEKISFHSNVVWRAQVTQNNAPNSHIVNMRVNYMNAEYVIVGSDPNFNPNNTRIYPVSNNIASNVLVNNGDYIAFAGWEPTPGGIDMSENGYLLDLWIDGDNATNTSWANLASATYTLEKGSPTAPVVRNSKMNFHKEIYFGNSDRSKLRTTVNYATTIGEGYHAFVVSENMQSGEHTLITFNPTNSDANARRASLEWNGITQIRGSWNTSATWATAAAQNFGIASMTVRNTTGAGNGRLYSSDAAGTTNINVTQFSAGGRLTIGNGSQDNSTSASGNRLAFNGNIQEVIVMRGGALMTANEIARVHSYLAIKYGMTLNPGSNSSADDYLASNGTTVVWSRTANSGYNNHIFGIGRDDLSGLYQKQARSSTSLYLTAFVGNAPATLNSDNSATLPDNQYLMIGSDGSSGIQQLTGLVYDGYLNGDMISTTPLNIQSPVYKSQLTNVNEMSVNTMVVEDFIYALVSTDAHFTPANTYIYPISEGLGEITLDLNHKFIKYVGFAPGPGGVTSGLTMWLRADDPFGVGITSMPSTDTRLTGYFNTVEDPDNVPTVATWSDLAHGHTYSHAVSSAARIPVFEKNDPEMNFKPAVRFWAVGSYGNNNAGYAAYLSNATGIMPSGNARPDHTIMIVLSHRFETSAPVTNALFFAGATGNTYNAPGCGLAKEGDNEARGRYRWGSAGGSITEGAQKLFSAGAVSILGYYSRTSAPTSMYFRFNGVEESATYSNATNIDFSRGSQLGRGYQNGRSIRGLMSEVVIYDKMLSTTEKIQAESYLALKYGITLRPNDTHNSMVNDNSTGYFNYTMSNGYQLWPGQTESVNLHSKYIVFYNNIAAIIRDDAARLYNRHAISTDVGSIMYMGVAGTELTDDGRFLGDFDYDREALIWGDNGAIGFTAYDEEVCGGFDTRFNRIWYVNKHTEDDRPMSALVSARNNQELSFGDPIAAPYEQEYYNKIHPGNDFFLIVADSPADITSGNFKAVIPMAWIDGKHQTNYVFTEQDTYVTFGFVTNGRGCFGDPNAMFNGLKTFQWTEYTARTNRLTGHVPQVPTVPFAFDLGDNITGNTYVTYVSPVRAGRGYPRSVTSPQRGSLEVRRSRGVINQEVAVKMQFAYPVIPSFTISGIDGRSRSYDLFQVEGKCEGETYIPRLSYASDPNRNTAYAINGMTATAINTRTMSATNLNGRMNVEFAGGVTEVTIKNRLKGRVSGTQRFFVSPITLRAALPPPPVDEAGIAFTQTAIPQEVSLCGEVTYTYHIRNVNCEEKKANFSVSLPTGMKWLNESLYLDEDYIDNQTLISDYADSNTLTIDNLVIPGSTTAIFTVIAYFDEDAEEGTYSNRAMLNYDLILNDVNTHINRESCDGLSMGCESTKVIALPGVRKQKLEITAFELDKTCYAAGDTITITIDINNPNFTAIPDAALEFFYNEGFSYVPGSFTSNIEDSEEDFQSDIYENTIVVPGGLLEEDEAGLVFIAQPIPYGNSTISFKIVAPNTLQQDFDENEVPLVDESGNPIYENLDIFFEFFTLSDDECAARLLYDAYGDKEIPALPNVYFTGPTTVCKGETSQLSRWLGGTWESSNPSVATVDENGEITGLSCGKVVFLFTVADSECVAVSDTFTVIEVVVSATNNGFICDGAEVTLTVDDSEYSGEATYQWYESASPTTILGTNSTLTVTIPGNYNVIVTDGEHSCSASEDIVIQTGTTPKAPVIAMPNGNYICGKDTQVILEITNIEEYTDPTYQWYKDNEPIPETNTHTYTPTEAGSYYVEITDGGCLTISEELEVIVNCYSPYGTIFPFVQTGDEAFDDQFVTTAKLYELPPSSVIDKVNYIRKQTPIQTVPVTYYDCDVDEPIVGAPKYPGVIGAINNPGLPIRWESIGITNSGNVNTDTLTEEDKCTDETSIGKYNFENIPVGDYVLEISRPGFLIRYGVITVEGDDYLGHRELLGGDVNGDGIINEKDLSIIRPKMALYGSPLYDATYDLTGTKSINNTDISIMRINFGAYITIYQETEDFLNQ